MRAEPTLTTMRRAALSGADIGKLYAIGISTATSCTPRVLWRRCLHPIRAPKLAAVVAVEPLRNHAVSRDYEPVPSQWYENLEEEESFRVLSVDEDSELIEIEYLDGDIEELDVEAWHEMAHERIAEPEGWAASQAEEEEEEDDEDDEDWDEDEDDEDDDEALDEDENEDRNSY